MTEPEARPPKISIKSKGSFGLSQEVLEEQLLAHRDAGNKVQQVEKDKVEAEKEKIQQERDKKIDDLLPRDVFCIFGEVSFGTFKEYYKDVWAQVADKVHLAKGFCSFKKELQPGLPVTVRTFKAKEFRQLQYLAPSPGDNYRGYLEDQIKFRSARLAVSITQFDTEEFPDLGALLAEKGVDNWEKMDIVKERIDWLDNFPEEMLSAMSALVTDVTQAYRLAVQENLKNQLAPLSPSTV